MQFIGTSHIFNELLPFSPIGLVWSTNPCRKTVTVGKISAQEQLDINIHFSTTLQNAYLSTILNNLPSRLLKWSLELGVSNFGSHLFFRPSPKNYLQYDHAA